MVVATTVPEEKLVNDYTTLLIMEGIDTRKGEVCIRINDEFVLRL